ncbi:hypothetical protein RD792_006849 [Penstemon davidsonii]|uniref:Uncharacterized protein n=1 Tax=Penstemon davidsonii TaxID=160366 RepID=A0ABR0DCR9_9LAMI|nr:hypothetical protein RD792_006849 [Penstemon davidsonii]
MWADPNRIRNPVGNFRWVHAMKWVGQKKFGSVPLAPFVVDGVKSVSTANSLTSIVNPQLMPLSSGHPLVRSPIGSHLPRDDRIEELTTEVRNFTKDLEAKQVEWSNVVSKFENMLGSATAASQANTKASNTAWTGPPKSSVDKVKGPAIHIGGSRSRDETHYKQGNGQTNVLDKKGSTSKARCHADLATVPLFVNPNIYGQYMPWPNTTQGAYPYQVMPQPQHQVMPQYQVMAPSPVPAPLPVRALVVATGSGKDHLTDHQLGREVDTRKASEIPWESKGRSDDQTQYRRYLRQRKEIETAKGKAPMKQRMTKPRKAKYGTIDLEKELEEDENDLREKFAKIYAEDDSKKDEALSGRAVEEKAVDEKLKEDEGSGTSQPSAGSAVMQCNAVGSELVDVIDEELEYFTDGVWDEGMPEPSADKAEQLEIDEIVIIGPEQEACADLIRKDDRIEELTMEVRNFTKDLEAKQVEWSNVVSKFENMLGSATAASQANTKASNTAWTGPPKSSVDKVKGPAIHIGGSRSRDETPYKQGNGQTNVLDKKGSTSKARCHADLATVPLFVNPNIYGQYMPWPNTTQGAYPYQVMPQPQHQVMPQYQVMAPSPVPAPLPVRALVVATGSGKDHLTDHQLGREVDTRKASEIPWESKGRSDDQTQYRRYLRQRKEIETAKGKAPMKQRMTKPRKAKYGTIDLEKELEEDENDLREKFAKIYAEDDSKKDEALSSRAVEEKAVDEKLKEDEGSGTSQPSAGSAVMQCNAVGSELVDVIDEELEYFTDGVWDEGMPEPSADKAEQLEIDEIVIIGPEQEACADLIRKPGQGRPKVLLTKSRDPRYISEEVDRGMKRPTNRATDKLMSLTRKEVPPRPVPLFVNPNIYGQYMPWPNTTQGAYPYQVMPQPQHQVMPQYQVMAPSPVPAPLPVRALVVATGSGKDHLTDHQLGREVDTRKASEIPWESKGRSDDQTQYRRYLRQRKEIETAKGKAPMKQRMTKPRKAKYGTIDLEKELEEDENDLREKFAKIYAEDDSKKDEALSGRAVEEKAVDEKLKEDEGSGTSQPSAGSAVMQ